MGDITLVDITLDTKGLNCPLPILKAKKTLREVPINGLLEILATDPGAEKDFIAFCKTTGHELIEYKESEGIYRFLIKRVK